MSEDFSTPADVGVRLMRPLTAPEEAAAASLLARASAMLRARFPGITDRLVIDADAAIVVAGITADAVARVLDNPSGYVREALDDWSGQRVDAFAGGFLFFTDAEWADLTAAAVPPSLEAAAPAGAYTVSLWG